MLQTIFCKFLTVLEESRQLLNSISGRKGPEDSAISCRFSKKIHINWKIASLRLNDLRNAVEGPF